MTDENKANSKEQGEPSQEFQNFQRLLKQVLSAPKEKVDRRKAEYERERGKKRAD